MAALSRNPGRADHLDRRQSTPSIRSSAGARDNGVIVIASNVDDTEGADGNARQAFIGQGFIPAGYSLGKKPWPTSSRPKGKIKAVVGVSAPGQNWSEQRAARASSTTWKK